MVRAEFEEKEYESNGNFELARWQRLARVYAPGQVLESVVGYDAAARPGRFNPIWRVLGLRRPRGVLLLPNMWPAGARPPRDRMPPRTVNFIVQYKRADYMTGASSKQAHLWPPGQSYFRFSCEPRQHAALTHLEYALGSDAIVRYAAPAFWRRSELDQHKLAGETLRSSGFLSPGALGHHTVWTYTEPGQKGKGNPDGELIAFESFAQIVDRVASRLRSEPHQTINESIRKLAAAAMEVDAAHGLGILGLVNQWIVDVRPQIELTDDRVDLLRDYAAATSVLTSIGAQWALFGKGSAARVGDSSSQAASAT